jgi:heat shock protein HslJ
MKFFIFVISGLLFLPGCRVFTESSEMPTLGDNQWQLIAMDQKPVNLGSNAYIKFNEKDLKVGGKAACNTFFADFERSGDKISFSIVGSTKMYCEGLMEVEGQIITNLQKVKRYEVKYGLLYLFGSDDLLLTFKKVNVN